MPATPNVRGKRLSATGRRPSVGLEALEPRALLSAAPTGPTGDAGSTASVAPVSADPAVTSQPANRAEAIAEAMKSLGLDPATLAADSTAAPSTPAATAAPAASSGHASKRRRVKPNAVRAHHPTPSATPSTPVPANPAAVGPVFVPAYPVAVDAATSIDDGGDSVLRADGTSSGGARLPETAGPIGIPAARRLVADESVLVLPKAPAPRTPAPQLQRSESPFGTVRITQALLPAVATRLARASTAGASALGLVDGNLPDWLIVGPQGQYVFTDRELFFKAGVMVLGVAGLVAGYCGYLQVTRARRQAEARAKVEIYTLFGWQESF